jgi:hypothetical protein
MRAAYSDSAYMHVALNEVSLLVHTEDSQGKISM